MPRSLLDATYLPPDRVNSSQPVHAIDAEHGMEVRLNGATEILLHVSNDGPSTATVTISPCESERRASGEFAAERVQIAPLESRFVGPIQTQAFTQQGGVMWLDFTPETAGRISVFRLS